MQLIPILRNANEFCPLKMHQFPFCGRGQFCHGQQIEFRIPDCL